MKQQINEIKRMQQLAGIIKESQLNENEPVDNIESGIKRIINSKPNPRKSNDTSFLDDVTNSQFIAALRNLRITYKKSRDTYGTDFHLGEEGNDWTFSNEGGTWHAIPSQERLNHN